MPTRGMSSAPATRSISAVCRACRAAAGFAAGVLLAASTASAQSTLAYSSYFDGRAVLARAPDGAIVAAGVTYDGNPDVRVVKLAPVTHAVIWSRTYGGVLSEEIAAVAVAPDGSVWLSGTTGSPDFPIVNPIQTGPANTSSASAYLLRLSADGTTILFSTLTGLGGESSAGAGLAVTAAGTVVWTGGTTGGTVRTSPSALQPASRGERDLFIITLSPTGAFIAGTYLGGSAGDFGPAVAADPSGAIYVSGDTFSKDFPTTSGAFQPTAGSNTCLFNQNSTPCYDGFLAKLEPDLSRLDYSTYLRETAAGSTSANEVIDIGGIAVNAAGEAFVTGGTGSGNLFPTTAGAYQPRCKVCTFSFEGGTGDAFVVRVNAAGSGLVYSTFLSGQTLGASSPRCSWSLTAGTGGAGIAIDENDRAYVTGSTTTSDFPTVNAYQSSLHGCQDAFLARFDATGATLEYSSYLGGSLGRDIDTPPGEDAGHAVVLDNARGGAVWVGGYTSSSDFPLTPGAYKSRLPEIGFGGFVSELGLARPLLTLDIPLAGPVTPPFGIGGWAIDRNAAADAGIDAVHVYAFPNPGSGAPPMFVGATTVGRSRPDVAAVFGAQFANAGWGIEGLTLAPGSYMLAAFARGLATGTFDVVATRMVTVPAPVPQPILIVDAPASGAVVPPGAPLAIYGWAIDRGAVTGTGMDAIHVWIFPSSGAPFFGGVATYGASRPDVGAIFGAPFTASGYALDVTGLTPGSYVIAVCAHSTVTNTFSVILTRTVTIQ
jgi:hypothetical protein